MERYRFVVLDGSKVTVVNRDFVATDDNVAVRLADGWRDIRGGQVWRGDTLIKHWRRGSNAFGRG